MATIRKAVLLVLASCLISSVYAGYQIKTSAECSSCTNSGLVSCRQKQYDRFAFCCDESEVGRSSCGGPDAFCTSNSLDANMNTFACPYNRKFCGATTSQIEMHPEFRNNLIIEIENRLFVENSVCYYQFYVPISNLDLVNNKYFFEVDFERIKNTKVFIMNGTDINTAEEPLSVNFFNGYTFQYNAEDNQLFMTMTANQATATSTDPSFRFQIRLYTFRVTPYDTDGETDPIKNETPVTDTETNTETVIVVDVDAKPRKPQIGLTVLTLAATIGILIYLAHSVIATQLDRMAERRALKEAQQEITVDRIKSDEALSVPDANGFDDNQSLEHLKSMSKHTRFTKKTRYGNETPSDAPQTYAPVPKKSGDLNDYSGKNLMVQSNQHNDNESWSSHRERAVVHDLSEIKPKAHTREQSVAGSVRFSQHGLSNRGSEVDGGKKVATIDLDELEDLDEEEKREEMNENQDAVSQALHAYDTISNHKSKYSYLTQARKGKKKLITAGSLQPDFVQQNSLGQTQTNALQQNNHLGANLGSDLFQPRLRNTENVSSYSNSNKNTEAKVKQIPEESSHHHTQGGAYGFYGGAQDDVISQGTSIAYLNRHQKRQNQISEDDN